MTRIKIRPGPHSNPSRYFIRLFRLITMFLLGVTIAVRMRVGLLFTPHQANWKK